MQFRFGDAAAHTAALQHIAAEVNPGDDVRVLHGSEKSSVVQVGDLLYKSPHSGADDNNATVRFEAGVAGMLPETAHLKTGTTLALPQLVATHPEENPPYNVLRFVPGEILTVSAIVQCHETIKTQLGRDLGSFVVWVANTIPESELNAARSSIAPAMTLITALRDYRLPHLATIRAKGYDATADLLEEVVYTPSPAYHNSAELLAVGHSDLRPANMTFENHRLKGVFDFGGLTLADPAEELRFTCFMGEGVAAAAIQQFYEETGVRIPEPRLQHYATAQALLSASFCALYGVNETVTFSSYYRDFLDQHYPDRDWSELNNFPEFTR